MNVEQLLDAKVFPPRTQRWQNKEILVQYLVWLLPNFAHLLGNWWQHVPLWQRWIYPYPESFLTYCELSGKSSLSLKKISTSLFTVYFPASICLFTGVYLFFWGGSGLQLRRWFQLQLFVYFDPCHDMGWCTPCWLGSEVFKILKYPENR